MIRDFLVNVLATMSIKIKGKSGDSNSCFKDESKETNGVRAKVSEPKTQKTSNDKREKGLQAETKSREKTDLEKLREVRARLIQTRESLNSFRVLEPLRKQFSFANKCLESEELDGIDTFVAHEVLPLLAGKKLANKHDANLICNVVEIPSFRDRAVQTNWDDAVLDIIDSQALGQLKSCGQLITIGDTLGKNIGHLNERVTVLPNYRYKEELSKSNELREMCGVGEKDKLVIAISTVATGFEVVLEALAKLDSSVHLVTLGNFVPKDYQQKVEYCVGHLGLSDRVHFFEPVEYDKLTSYASGADLGLIIRDPKIKNNFVSLPNRIFDYISSEVPVITPDIPDISSCVMQYDIGTIVTELNAEGWKDAIEYCLERTAAHKENLKKARAELTWESLEETILEIFKDSHHIAFLGMNKLANNNRTLRIAKTLLEHDKKVSICTVGNESEIKYSHPELQYVLFDKL